ncbi:uncharacterized protein N7473_009044 [Penicillium subrubescens]|uniref:Letm1 RBD domain-containing protein n=1 Tax=Penicillium subrubescens TaxID=1316194 RepID=A0A1Q5TRN0_9EURO|nr:uncharacterized protein N7473_009044 [Penicillium subrubescens]KAJ5886370.1 hypothetical protein N7473_009044 [Penicillium subrubescens]OKP02886.1 hypothetical protein PENSUB_6958 [Penicillium subrubescens]
MFNYALLPEKLGANNSLTSDAETPRNPRPSPSTINITTSHQTMAPLARVQIPLVAPLRPSHHAYTPLRPIALACHHASSFSTSAASHAAKQQPRARVQATKSITPVSPTPTLENLSQSHINAPISTFPAIINIPDPLPTSAPTPEKLKRLVAVGRAYLTFYKTGLKNVYHNYRASLPLRRELGLPAYLPVSPPRTTKFESLLIETPETKLGRGRFQLVRRSARDVQRMIPFTLILIICGEFTPLIVPIFGNAITPATCRVPGQVTKEREAGSKRKVLAQQALAAATGEAVPVTGSDAERAQLLELTTISSAQQASAQKVLQACAMFGLVKKHDRFLGTMLAGPVYRPRLLRHLHYLNIDDRMILDAGVDALSAEEVRIAVEERGAGDVSAMLNGAKAEAVEREWLKKWLSDRREVKE